MHFLNTSFVWFFAFCFYWTVAFFFWVIKFFISRKSVLGNLTFCPFSLWNSRFFVCFFLMWTTKPLPKTRFAWLYPQVRSKFLIYSHDKNSRETNENLLQAWYRPMYFASIYSITTAVYQALFWIISCHPHSDVVYSQMGIGLGPEGKRY